MAETDEEQIEAIKKWWDENGKSMLIGIVLALAGVFGYQAWQNQAREQGEAASALYENLLDAVALDDPFATLDEEAVSTGEFIANQLKDEYSDTTYAHFAAMFMAKLAVENGDYEGAEKELAWVLENGVDDSLAVIVKSRLARVQLARGEHDAALATLDGVEPGEHMATVQEIRGDALMAKGEDDRAREAYQLAVNSLEADERRPLLQMKLDDLIVPATPVPVTEEYPVAPSEEPKDGE